MKIETAFVLLALWVLLVQVPLAFALAVGVLLAIDADRWVFFSFYGLLASTLVTNITAASLKDG